MKMKTLICIFITIYAVYYLTLYSSIPGGDSGELLAESCQFGTAHPPGYPFYTILCIVFQHFLPIPRIYYIHLMRKCVDYIVNKPDILPASVISWLSQVTDHNKVISILTYEMSHISSFNTDNYTMKLIDWNSSVAWRMNHMCCIFGAIAATLLSCSCYELLHLKKMLEGLVEICDSTNNKKTEINFHDVSSFSLVTCAVLYAFSPIIWEYSIGSEVFALNNLLCSLLIYLAIVIYKRIFLMNMGQLSDNSVSIKDMISNASLSTDLREKYERYLDEIHSINDIPTYRKKYYDVVMLLCCGSLCCGLTLANQHTSLLYIIVLVPFMLILICGGVWNLTWLPTLNMKYNPKKPSKTLRDKDRINNSKLFSNLLSLISITGLCFFLGFIPTYSYLVIASLSPKPGSWGDIASVHGLLQHMLRSEYGTFQLGGIKGSEDMFERIIYYVKHIQGYTYNLGVVLSIVGLIWILIGNCNRKYVIQRKHNHTNTNIEDSTTVKNSNKKFNKKHHNKQVHQKQSHNSVLSNPGTPNSADNNHLKSNDSVLYSVTYTSAIYPIIAVLFVTWALYVCLWHGILSNVPLDAPMPRAVHARFWMQPDLLIILFMSLGITGILENVYRLCSFIPLKLYTYSMNIIIIGIVIQYCIVDRYPMMDRSDVGMEALYTASTNSIYGSHTPHYVKKIIDNVLAPPVDDHTSNLARIRHVHPLDNSILSMYGRSILNSLPRHAVLASHTDLDWNTVRYLKVCEGDIMRENNILVNTYDDITHVSFQLMPYPWFIKQQAPLYHPLKFPKPFTGVATNRLSEGNALLVSKFLSMNWKRQYRNRTHHNMKHKEYGGIYLDMQSVNDAELESGGIWRKTFTLIPWGLLYRVEKTMNLSESSLYHKPSWEQLQQIRSTFPPVSSRYMIKYPPGSWEFAAMSVVHDGHYQYALHLLTYCMGIQKGADLVTLLLIVDRLLTSSSILLDLRFKISAHSKQPPHDSALSSSVDDLIKNNALCWLRLHGIVNIAKQFHSQLLTLLLERESIKKNGEVTTGLKFPSLLLNYNAVLSLIQSFNINKTLTTSLSDSDDNMKEEVIEDITTETLEAFIQSYPKDKDVKVFKNSLDNIINNRNQKQREK